MHRVALNPEESKPASIQVSNRNLSVVTQIGSGELSLGDVQIWAGDGQPVTSSGLAKAAGVAGPVTIHDSTILPK
jgi:hypothetical protein